MGISSGLFNQTLTLYSLTETDDGMGGRTTSWSPVGSFRARISPISSQETIAQNKLTATATHKIFCDSMTVTHDNRILYGSTWLEVVGVINPSESFHHLEIYVKEIG